MKYTKITKITSQINIYPASLIDFENIKLHISNFELDNQDLQINQFIVAKQDSILLGFARIRSHQLFNEYCSLGVIEKYRQHGVAKKITEAIINQSKLDVYLVCIIPEYFEKLGFKIETNYPHEMKNKLDYCKSALIVEENYVVMKYSRV